MTADQVRERIAEFASIRANPGDDLVARLEAGLFVEEVFGLELTDDDMTSEALGSHRAIERLIIRRLGVK